ncbi:RrF2 family transcriptional regulator [Oleomonas cavernae]|nr:Rrf2 family transcriptional regulator [Oleomonas cavernae]
MAQSSSHFAVALHVLVLLGTEGDRPLNSDCLAASTGSHPVMIRRIVGQLREAGLVTAQRGREGGFRLSRPAAEITLGQVYQAIEEGEIFARHHNPNPACTVGQRINGLLCPVFSDAKSAVIERLGQKNLAALISGS